jgi:hypothetical protein
MKKAILFLLISFGIFAEFRELKSGKKVFMASTNGMVFSKILDETYFSTKTVGNELIMEEYVQAEFKNESGKSYKYVLKVSEDGTSLLTVIEPKLTTFITQAKSLKLIYKNDDGKSREIVIDKKGLDLSKVK